MEPVTHILTGACLARTGLNRRAAYTTLAMAVAAEFPDIDTLWGLRGPVSAFLHHRGITHTLLGLPFEAALIVAGVAGFHRWRVARAQAVPNAGAGPAVHRPLTQAPVRWAVLYGFTLLALLSHLWLDYTNNYGLRPFFPFNPRWYAASFTFIFDPAMFALLLFALLLPPLFRLIGAEVGVRRQPFAPRGWAVAALLGVCALWGWRAAEHRRAEAMAQAQSYTVTLPARPDAGTTGPASSAAPTSAPEPLPVILQAQRVLASPDPFNPFRWYTVVDFGPLYQLGTVDLLAGTLVPEQAPEAKLSPSPTLRAAESSPLGRAYLDWSPMPFLNVLHGDLGLLQADHDDHPAATVVVFRDPRFLGGSPWLRVARSRAPLTGTVELNALGAVVLQTMDGKVQR